MTPSGITPLETTLFSLMWIAGCTLAPSESAEPVGPIVRFRQGEVIVRGGWPGAAEMGLSLAAVGERESQAVAPDTDGERTTYSRPGVTEWWEPTARGLEQGFVVDELPAVGPLVLELALRGAKAAIDPDGRSATFAVAGGGRVRYTGLAAWDARGADLPAWMEDTTEGLRLVVDTEGAVPPITIDPVMPTPTWTVAAAQSSWLGHSVAFAGDVNGDGYDDLLAGAPFQADGQRTPGAASLYLGSSAGPAVAPAWTATTSQGAPGASGPRLGWSVAGGGDVNGDGYDDVVVGAPSWRGPAGAVGAVLVYHGSAAGLPASPDTIVEDTLPDQFSIDLSALADLTGDGFADLLVATYFRVGLYPGSANGLLPTESWSVSGQVAGPAGDFDGDGHLDVVVTYSSTVRVYPGAAGGPASAPSWSVTEPQVNTSFGTALAAVDLNGDGYDDLAIGAPSFDAPAVDAGRVSVYLGSPTGLALAPAWIATGSTQGAFFGSALSGAGDLNGDGFAELWVGVEQSWNVGGGRVELYLGSPTGPQSEVAWLAEESDNAAAFGSALDGLGDMDGDGRTDLIVGASLFDGGKGEVAAWSAAAIDVSDIDGDGVLGGLDGCPNTADPLQVDTDGDGIGDACDRPTLAVSMPVTRGEVATLTASGVMPGEVVRFGGAPGGPGAGPCLPPLGGLCLELGPAARDLGQAVADAGGRARLQVTVPLTVQPNGRYTVQAAVVRGVGGVDSVDSPTVTLDGGDLDWDGDGLTDAEEVALGTEPTLADSDGDWLDDGDEAPYFDPVSDDTDGDGELDGWDQCWVGDDFGPDGDGDGTVDLCDVCRETVDPAQGDGDGDGLGDACEGDVLLPLVTLGSGTAHWSEYGASVASGDVNGDGYDDVVVGQPGEPNEVGGTARVYHGSAAGPSTVPAWTQDGPRAFESGYGTSVACADVNGDGYDDVLVGEPLGWSYDSHNPTARLYLGSSAGLDTQSAWSNVDNGDSEWSAWVASAGDVDGDGYGDALIGNGLSRTALFRGGPAGLRNPAIWTSAEYGLGGAAGDLNGDGVDDLWVAQPSFLGGRVAVYLGGGGGLQDAWWSSRAGGPAGAVGDVDGDGYADLIAGTALQLGGPTGFVAQPGWSLSEDVVVAAAGDVNGDGYADVALGDPSFQNGQRGEGGAGVLLGAATGLAAGQAWHGESNQAGYTETDPLSGGSWFQEIGFGSALAWGDLDGDGLSDVIVGAPYHGNRHGGSVFSYRGNTP